MEKIELISEIVNDKFTEYVCNEYDIQNREKTITEIPLMDLNEIKDEKWNILIILGNSGSGKSTLLKQYGYNGIFEYDYSKSIVSQFPWLTEEEVCDLFCSVGLSSVPTWLRKPNELSNGEKARLDICAAIAKAKNDNNIIVIDEFTSVVNRDVAKSMSFALQRYIRKYNLKCILASCHFDLMDWLQPDFIFNLNKTNKDEEVEFEKIIYSDDENYKAYQNINKNDILSDSKSI